MDVQENNSDNQAENAQRYNLTIDADKLHEMAERDSNMTLTSEQALLVRQKDEEIDLLHQQKEELEIKMSQQQAELETLKTYLKSIYAQTEKIHEKAQEEEQKNDLKSLLHEISKTDKEIYQEALLKHDKEYFQGQSQDSNQYDIRVILNSMRDLCQQKCKIQYFEKENKKRERMDNIKKCAVIGFQGVKNRGKTFLLNLLNNEKFPSAFYESTLGISAKVDFQENSNKIYLDSEGVQKPTRFEWEKQYQKKTTRQGDEESKFLQEMQEQVLQNFFDIKATEQLQQEFLLQSCEIVIIVVGMISIEDQKLISSIVDRRLACQIIVVHNYKELKEIKYVERHIEENLMYQFPLSKHGPDLQLKLSRIDQPHNKFAYIDRRYRNVAHVILANNKSEAGEYYNQFSLEYIRKQIQLNSKQKPFVMSDEFVKFLNNYLPNYIEFKNQEKGKGLVKKQIVQNECIIQLDKQLEIKKIKDITLDVFGRIINAINYSVIQFKKDETDFKKIDIELPGNVSFDLKNCAITNDEKGKTILMIKAIKLQDVNYSENLTHEDKRLYGEFILKLTIGKAEEKLTQVGAIVNNKNGVYTLNFKVESSEIDCIVHEEEESS